ncbi:lipopolysaccharide biosynthesis protein [Enterococcus hailinensis]|uniref:lipopolysaccharide biosynthesis protein n=1 Tax=Enterococcus hailinensis TaxID=3238988 RepID=UPI0038B30364
MENTRTSRSIINSSVAMITQIITLILQFVMQTIFIHTLGATYLGINGLFTNVLSILSFAELGIGNAITYSLYKPLAVNDKAKIQLLMNFFRKAYNTIGLIILVLGLIFTPFIRVLIKGADNVNDLHLYFILFLLNSVVSYFFSYKRTLLIADQKGYLSTLNIFYFKLAQSILQIIFLLETHNFFIYLIVQIIFTLLSNIRISIVANKLFPFLKEKTVEKLSKEDFNKIKMSTLGLIGSQIGAIVVTNTNNLLISAFVGVFFTGIYSSYMLIQQGVRQVINQAMDAIIASLGNLATENNRDKIYRIYNQHLFLSWSISFFCSIYFITLFNPFVSIWLGKKYLFSMDIVFLIVLNFYIGQNRKTPLSFINSQGLFVKAGVKSICEAVLNLIVCFILLIPLKLGIVGVLLGTTTVNIILNIWFEPWLVFREGLLRKIDFSYFLIYISRFLYTFVVGGIIYFIADQIEASLFITLVTKFIVVTVLTTLIYWITFRKDPKFSIITNIIRKTFEIIKIKISKLYNNK